MRGKIANFVGIFLTVALVGGTSQCLAWDNDYTHPYLTLKALDVYKHKSRLLDEFSRYKPGGEQLKYIDEGAVKEDYDVSNAGDCELEPDDVFPHEPCSIPSGWDRKLWGDQQDKNVPSYSFCYHGLNPIAGGESWDFDVNLCKAVGRGGRNTENYVLTIWALIQTELAAIKETTQHVTAQQ